MVLHENLEFCFSHLVIDFDTKYIDGMALLVADPHPAYFTAYTDTNSKCIVNHIFGCIDYIRNIITLYRVTFGIGI